MRMKRIHDAAHSSRQFGSLEFSARLKLIVVWELAVIIAMLLSAAPSVAAPASPALFAPALAVHESSVRDEIIVPVYMRRGAVVRRSTVVGPRGGVYRSRTVARGAVVRPGGARWARPGWYRWPVGGAIAAGAAIGVVSAGAAAAWAGPAPAPGMCWYYTDSSKTQGFWDYCR